MRLPTTVAAIVLASLMPVVTAEPVQNGFLGKWNLTGTGDDSNLVYWLEVREDGGALTGNFLKSTGNPWTTRSIAVEGDELLWVHQPREDGPRTEFRARLENGRLVGSHLEPPRGRRGGGEGRVINWVGVRPPVWPETDANASHTFGEPVALFDGTSFDAFSGQNPRRELGWTLADGVMGNEPGANNLVSHATFQDFKLEAEYRLGEGTNSGFYLRGRYELQVLADYGDTDTRRDLAHMAIYGRTPPSVNASRPVGEWQSMEAVIVGNRVTVTLNGQRVHDNAVIEGITGGALDTNESAPGPILVQGDHSGVWIRKLVVTPIVSGGR